MKELMVHVERAVRAVRANPTRKRRMRQELLAHLTNLVEEEKARGADEREALARALQRFGDPAGLSHELQASVPRLERWLARLFFRGPGESGLRHGARIATLGAAAVFVVFNLLPLIAVAAGARWSDARIGLGAVGVVAGYVFLSVLLCHGVLRKLSGRPGAAALLRASAYGAGAMLAGVALVAAGSVAQPENPLWWFILHYPGNPLALGAGAWFTCMPLAVALALVMIARVNRATARGQGDWASLEICE
jgi:hypothetical protein